MDTLERLWEILNIIPRQPIRISTPEIEAHLEKVGFNVPSRYVQRDLQYLASSKIFPLACDRRSKPYQWYWPRESAVFNIPGITTDTALALLLMHQYIGNLLPKSTRDQFKPYLQNARKVLERASENRLASWPDKIRVLSRNMQTTPPTYKQGIIETVNEALLKGRKLSVKYRPRGEKEVREYKDLNPLGLVFIDNLIYLVASIGDYDNPLQLLLHRMNLATIIDLPLRTPDRFTLQGYIDSGEFAYPVTNQTILLKALFDRESAAYLHETPLPGTISLSNYDEDNVLLEANVQDNIQLRYWLRGFGDEVEVLEPDHLRGEFRELAESLAEMYL